MLKKTLVRWQDGSYDPYEEKYKEVVTSKKYVDYSGGTSGSYHDSDEGGSEPTHANPDTLVENGLEMHGERHEPAARKIFREAKRRSLTTKQAQAWKLVKEQERDVTEAAEILGVTKSTVSELLTKAEDRIRRYCEENMHRIKEQEDDDAI